ncbi:MAG TPA: hypothetical protein VFX35_13355 [Solirubrobacterales bacterium]|nr:hypothetical protein [Solirubrobacterales bacterium]
MHELVRSTFNSKLLSALRLPSFAGEGLPERMRSISFALLGLTAAAGLALVAIFAQPSFSVLSPAPLPDQPSAGQSIAEARKLAPRRHLASLVPAQPARSQQGTGGSAVRSPADTPESSSGDGGEAAPAPAGVGAPAPSGPTGSSPGNDGGGGGGSGSGGGSSPAPTAAPEPSAAPAQGAAPTAPVASPQPTRPKPEVTTSNPQPESAPAPGNSNSAAAAEHASERGIEASGGGGPAAGGGATTAVVAPEPTAPGNGNGLAKGHDK